MLRGRDGIWNCFELFQGSTRCRRWLMNEFISLTPGLSSPDPGRASSTVLSFWLESCIRRSFPSSKKRVLSFTRKPDWLARQALSRQTIFLACRNLALPPDRRLQFVVQIFDGFLVRIA